MNDKLEITDQMVNLYVESLDEQAVACFDEMAKRLSYECPTIEEFVRHYLEVQYGSVNTEILRDVDVDPEFKSMEYNELVDLLISVDDDEGWSISDVKFNKEIIEASEAELGYILPKSLKKYLQQVGGMWLGDYYLPGLADSAKLSPKALLVHTEFLREHHSLPSGFFCLEYDFECSRLACLDLRMMEAEECPVVTFNIQSMCFEPGGAVNFDVWFRYIIGVRIELNRGG